MNPVSGPGASPVVKNTQLALSAAVDAEADDIFDWLLRHPSMRFDQCDADGTALHFAAMRGKPDGLKRIMAAWIKHEH